MRIAMALLVAVSLTACSHTAPRTARTDANAHPAPGTVLLMPPDVELYLVHAGGMREPRADWTRSATAHIQKAIEAELREAGSRMVVYTPPAAGMPEADTHVQLIKLHEVVGVSAIRFAHLPTIKGRFDWTLGPEAGALRKGNEADYALFVHIRDSYATGGRKTMAVLGALFGGVYVSTGRQFGFASLVDLKTGKLLWFNRLFRESGDLRSYGPARETVRKLLDKFPL